MRFALKDEIDKVGNTTVDVSDLPKITKQPFLATFTPVNIISGF